MLGVVVGAFGGVGEDFVGFDDFAETVCGGGVWGVVWMVLFYELEVARFDVFWGCVVGQGKYFVWRGIGGMGWPGDVWTGRRFGGRRRLEEERGGCEGMVVYSASLSLQLKMDAGMVIGGMERGE